MIRCEEVLKCDRYEHAFWETWVPWNAVRHEPEGNGTIERISFGKRNPPGMESRK